MESRTTESRTQNSGGRAFVVGPDESLWPESPLPGIGMQLLAGVEQTGGQYAFIRQTLEVEEIYPHVHDDEDESLYLTDGEITVSVGGESFDMTPGSFIFLPRGIPHAIKPHTPTFSGLSVCASGGSIQTCMEDILARTAAGDQLTPEALVDIHERHGIRTVDPEGRWFKTAAS